MRPYIQTYSFNSRPDLSTVYRGYQTTRRVLIVAALLLLVTAWTANAQVKETTLDANASTRIDRFGTAIAMDNNRAVIAAPSDGSQLYVFEKSFDGWIEQRTVVPLDAGHTGESVDLSGDIFVSGSSETALNGAAYIFELQDGNWLQRDKVEPNEPPTRNSFGTSVATFGDFVVVGAPFMNEDAESSGAVYVFERQPNSNDWQEVDKLRASDLKENGSFGIDLAMNDEQLIIGSSGTVYVFELQNGAWTEVDRLTPGAVTSSVVFGHKVALNEDLLIIGDRSDSEFASSSGAAYIYKFDGNAWQQDARLSVPESTAFFQFGRDVAIEDGIAAVTSSQLGNGTLYVYEDRGNGSWELVKDEIPDDRVDGGLVEQFGHSLAISNADIIVGADLGSKAYSFQTGVQTPFPLAPQNQISDIPADLTFAWNLAEGADAYRIQVAEDEAFRQIAIDSSGISSNRFPARLNANTRYYWRIRSIQTSDEMGWSSGWSTPRFFTTQAIQPPFLAAPANGAIGQGFEVELVWNRAGGATAYDVQVATDNQFANPLIDATSVADTVFMATGLEAGTTYFWRAQSLAGTSGSGFGAVFSFSTLNVGIPVLTAPADGADGVFTTTTLSWSTATNADSYAVQLATDAQFSAVVQEASNLNTTSVEVAGLDPATTYFWRVQARVGGQDGPFGTPFSFTTLALSAPVSIAPGDGAFPEGPNVQVSWQRVETADSYRLQVAGDENFNNLIADEANLTDTGFLVRDLDSYKQYFWRVESIIGNVSGGFSETRTFVPYPSQIAVARTTLFGDIARTGSWRMIGFPGNVDVAVSAVLNGNPDEDWQVFHDNGGVDGNLTPFSPSFRFRPGRGFWVLSRDTLRIDQQVTSVLVRPEGTVTVPLNDGWNIITNPFEAPISWARVLAANEGVVEDIWSFQGTYTRASSFSPYEGFYFFNADNRNQLNIPVPITNAPALAERPVDKTDQLQIVARNDAQGVARIVIGEHGDAADRLDVFDRFSPPAAFAEVSLRLINQALPTAHKSLYREYRPTAQNQTFDVQLRGKAGERIQLEAIIGEVFNGREIYLIDEATAQRYDLRDAQTSISLEKDQQSFRLLIGNASFVEEELEELVPAEVKLMDSYPNPMQQRANVPYAIASRAGSAAVTLEVFDILGRRVKTLVDERQDDGLYEATWDGRADNGSEVSSGMYLIRLKVDQQHQTRQLVVVR